MAYYIVRRFAHLVPTLLAATFLLFLLVYLSPGKTEELVFPERNLGPTQTENLRARYGWRDGLFPQYFDYMSGLVSGDLGTSFRQNRPVNAIIGEALPNSFKLAAWAFVIEVCLGVAAGAAAVFWGRRWIDMLIMVSVIGLISVPVFWIGHLLQMNLALRAGWLPASGLSGGWTHYLLPALTLAAASTAFVALVSRTSLDREMNSEYARTARAHGLPGSQVLLRHAGANALSPVITVVALDFGLMIGSAVATEVVFNWPGIGYQLWLAALARDRPVILGISLVMLLIFLTLNALVDLVYVLLQPKLRLRERHV